jgi:TRAP-type C4-dicarboxylate transport system permease large subunit
MTVVIIPGGTLPGVFIATEAGSVACLCAFFVTMIVYRGCKWRDLPRPLVRVVRTVGMVMIMIGFSVAFACLMALIQLPAKAAAAVRALISPPTRPARMLCRRAWRSLST